jgi:hypothetical protein
MQDFFFWMVFTEGILFDALFLWRSKYDSSRSFLKTLEPFLLICVVVENVRTKEQ